MPVDLLSVMLGALLGGGAAVVLTVQSRRRAVDAVTQKAEAERALLAQRLETADRARRELSLDLDEKTDALAARIQENHTIEQEKARLEARLDRLPAVEAQLREALEAKGALELEKSTLNERLSAGEKALAEQRDQIETAKTRLTDTFKALSADVLKRNNEEFLKLAHENFKAVHENNRGDLEKRQLSIQGLVEPMQKSLQGVNEKLIELEKSRSVAYTGLMEQVRGLLDSQKDLRTETANLSRALRSPNVRGQWGELQLERVVELAGMVEYCDFTTQTTLEDRSRPDMIARLPGGKTIAVDAKAPFERYLAAQGEGIDGPLREKLMGEYVDHVRARIRDLSKKSYWQQLESPEFVVLFLPGESFYSAALERDPSLIEESFRDGVLLATPTTLIALLKAVAYGWRQEALTDNAREIRNLGTDLYKSINRLGDHFARLGRSVRGTVDHYNKAVGSLERSVLSTARQLRDKRIAEENSQIARPEPVDGTVRDLTRAELLSAPGEDAPLPPSTQEPGEEQETALPRA